MKLSKALKIEGIILIILTILGVTGMILYYGPYYNLGTILGTLAMYGSASILHMIIILVLFYWIYKVYKYQKTSA